MLHVHEASIRGRSPYVFISRLQEPLDSGLFVHQKLRPIFHSMSGTLKSDTIALADTDWRIEDIVGRAVLEEAPATLRIEADGRVSGRTGCNLFTGSAEVGEEEIRFGPLSTTGSVCPPALMEQEQRLLQAFATARSFAIDERGLLHLKGEYEPFLLRATPVRGR